MTLAKLILLLFLLFSYSESLLWQKCEQQCGFLRSTMHRIVASDGTCETDCRWLERRSRRRFGWECGECEAAPSATPSTAPSTAPTPADSSIIYNTALGLSGVENETLRTTFLNAAARWDEVIVGDVPDQNLTLSSRCDPDVPALIDDIFICANVTPNDGFGGILGQAGPEWARAGSFFPYTGYMEFDEDDVEELLRRNEWESVVVRTLWAVCFLSIRWCMSR